MLDSKDLAFIYKVLERTNFINFYPKEVQDAIDLKLKIISLLNSVPSKDTSEQNASGQSS